MTKEKTAEEIQVQMATLRSELDEGVDEIVDNARVLADWRHYVRRYPWICLGAAAAAGFAVVPRRLELVTPDPDALLELAKKNRIVVKTKPEAQTSGPSGMLFNLLANTLMRGALGYAGQKIGAMLENEQSTEESKP